MLTPVPVPGKRKSSDICDAFIAGAPRGATGFVFYGVNEANLGEYRKAKASGLDVYMIDNSAFDCVRGVQFRVTKNRYHHDGQGQSDGRRFAALGLTIRPPIDPFDPGRNYILAVEQSSSYMVCVAREPLWLERALAGRGAVVYRVWQRDKRKAMGTLADDLTQARVTVTHSSAAAVESLLAGVPVYVSAASPCFGVLMADRHRMFGVLADNQFTLAEMRSGFSWKALNE